MTDAGHLAVVVGNPRRDSRTTVAARAVADRLLAARSPAPELRVIELADLAPELLAADGERRDEAIAAVMDAEALVVASPVYKASYTGLLKAFLDGFGAGSLGGKPCAAVMLGGSPAHSLATEVHLRPLLAEIGASTLPGLYIVESDLPALEQHVQSWWVHCERMLQYFTNGDHP